MVTSGYSIRMESRPPWWFRVLWRMRRQNRHWPPCEKRNKAMYRNWLDYCDQKQKEMKKVNA